MFLRKIKKKLHSLGGKKYLQFFPPVANLSSTSSAATLIASSTPASNPSH